jgi:molybdopterin-containing oxidoreductase family iron-sulfur binding subunit
MEKENKDSDRRKFLKFGLLAGGATIAGLALQNNLLGDAPAESGTKVKVLTADGKLVEIDSSKINYHPAAGKITNLQAREGIEGKKFVMVIDLARCANARKCVEGCQKMHHKAPPVEWIKVKKMQEAETTAPYWMPQPCFHCDNPPCTKVCPVDATFKRQDGIVLIDNERCIGCRFCMAACPYNARSFNWGESWGEAIDSTKKEDCCDYTPEKSVPGKMGTVEKCDFCPDMAREGKLPDCVTACPNGTIFFGDANEDVVTNGEETFRLSELIKKRSGYRYLEELGTEPRVYYLPPTNRQFPFEEDPEKHNVTE